MSEDENELGLKLWSLNSLKGSMDLYQYKDYLFGFIFYKYLSEKLELEIDKLLKNDNMGFEDAWENDNYKPILMETSLNILGYFISPEYLFRNIISNENDFILDDLSDSLNYIMDSTLGFDSEDNFIGIFDDVDLSSIILGDTVRERNKKITEILNGLNEIDFELEKGSDKISDAFEYLVGRFASESGKKGGEFYTPKEVSEIMARIVSLNKSKVKDVYDPACGTGSLLLKVTNYTEVSNLCGEEINFSTYNLARMNMIIHNINYHDFDIEHGNSIEYPKFIDQKFEAVVSNPPFSSKWSSDKKFFSDPRFSAYERLPPKTRADYTFVQDMIYHLSEDGTMAVVLPPGVLFRGMAEEKIRTYLIKEMNYLDAVIGLPPSLFYGTSIPTVLLIFKKHRFDSENVLFIDSSNVFEKLRHQNKLKQEDIDKIVDTYKNREDIRKFSRNVSLDEIEDNDFNLNIPRYIDTFEEEKPIDLDEIGNKIEEINQEIVESNKQIDKFCKELGIDNPFK